MSSPSLSVVIPIYNEEAVLPLLVSRVRPVLDGLEIPYEVLVVDDGSTDGTWPCLRAIARKWPELRVVRLLRNFGHQSALMAGLARARGAYCISMDADLQDPPEFIPTMITAARVHGVDVVYAVRSDRSSDSVLKRQTAAIFYRLIRRLAGPQVPYNAGDFRLMTRPVVDAVNALPESGRVLRLVVPWLGFPSTEVVYRRASRAAGASKFPLTKMARLAVDGVTSFSAAPLRLATWLGFFGFLACFVLIVFLAISTQSGRTVPGWTSTLLIAASIGAIQLLALGLLGEYVGRIFENIQRRPAYLVGFDSLGVPYPKWHEIKIYEGDAEGDS